MRVKSGQVGSVVFSGKGSGQQAGCPTKRAADGGESARFMDSFLALRFSTPQASTPPNPCPPLTPAVGRQRKIR